MFKLPKFLRPRGKEAKPANLVDLYKLSQKLYEDYDLFLTYYINLPESEKYTISAEFTKFLTASEFNIFNTRGELQIAVTEQLKNNYLKQQEVNNGTHIKS